MESCGGVSWVTIFTFNPIQHQNFISFMQEILCLSNTKRLNTTSFNLSRNAQMGHPSFIYYLLDNKMRLVFKYFELLCRMPLVGKMYND
jgi:hypothetical protein